VITRYFCLYAPVGKRTRSSRTSDCIRKLRFGRSYSKRYSRYDPPHIGVYRHRDSRLCRCICCHRHRTAHIARSRGIEKNSSSNRTAHIDPPCPYWIRVCKCIRSASSWGGRCIVRSSRTRNCRCTRLKRKEPNGECHLMRLASIDITRITARYTKNEFYSHLK